MYGENYGRGNTQALWVRMNWNKYYDFSTKYDLHLYNYTIYRIESYHKFLYEEKCKYENERRKIYEDDLY